MVVWCDNYARSLLSRLVITTSIYKWRTLRLELRKLVRVRFSQFASCKHIGCSSNLHFRIFYWVSISLCLHVYLIVYLGIITVFILTYCFRLMFVLPCFPPYGVSLLMYFTPNNVLLIIGVTIFCA